MRSVLSRSSAPLSVNGVTAIRKTPLAVGFNRLLMKSCSWLGSTWRCNTSMPGKRRSNAGDQSAVDANDRAGDVSGLLAREERHGRCVLARIAIASDRNRRHALRADFLDAAPFALGLLFVEEG